MPSLKKTKNLRLSQWAGNEYVSFNDIAEDNAKIDMAIGNKVDKEEGKGLSSNDYTNEDKAKLDGIDAQLSNIGVTMIPLLSNISDGKVDKEEGKGLSTNDFTNDYKNKLDTMEETFSNLCNTTMQDTSSRLLESVSSFVQSKVDKVSGKDLSSNDYTNADKNKVSNLPANTLGELNNLKQSVVSGKNTIATAINDLASSIVANSSMTHSDLAVAVRNLFPINQELLNNKMRLSSLYANGDRGLYFNVLNQPRLVAYGNGYDSKSNNIVNLNKGIYFIEGFNILNVIKGSVAKINDDTAKNVLGQTMIVVVVFVETQVQCTTYGRFVEIIKL